VSLDYFGRQDFLVTVMLVEYFQILPLVEYHCYHHQNLQEILVLEILNEIHHNLHQ
jgi:hypothetical protein